MQAPESGNLSTGSSNRILLDEFKKFFEQDDWPSIEEVEGRALLRMGFSGKNGKYRCMASTHEENQIMTFYAVFQFSVNEEDRLKVAEFIVRANYGLHVGCFEMDINDGEVRYRTSMDVEGTEITFTTIKNLVYTNLYTSDRYFPGLMKMIYGDATAEEAIAHVEKGGEGEEE